MSGSGGDGCPCPNQQADITVDNPNVDPGTCSETDQVNQQRTLALLIECQWSGTFHEQMRVCDNDDDYTIDCTYLSDTDEFELVWSNDEDTWARYTVAASQFNCSGQTTFSLQSNDGHWSNWPATINVTLP